MPRIDDLEIRATGSMDDALKKVDELIAKVQELPKSKTTTLRVKTYNSVKETRQISENVKQVVKEVESGAKRVQKATADTSSKLSTMFASIKRIAVYRLIRTAIKAVTQGFQEGIQNAYQWALANNHAFQIVMDTYATKALYLKNTLGALASTVLTALLPAFEWLVNVTARAIDTVNEFIAAISGQDSYLKAREVAVNFAEAVDDAAGAQKELNQQLMAFDELNVITTPKNRNRGSDDALNYNDMFYEDKVSDKMKGLANFAKQIKNAFKEIKLSDSFTSALSNVKGMFGDIFDFVGKIFDKMNDLGIPERFRQHVSNWLEKFNNILRGAKEIKEKLDKLGITDKLVNAIGKFADALERATNSVVTQGLEFIAGQLEAIGKFLDKDFTGGLKAEIQSIVDLAAGIASPFTIIMDEIGELIADLTGGRKSTNYYDELMNTVNSIKNQINGTAEAKQREFNKTHDVSVKAPGSKYYIPANEYYDIVDTYGNKGSQVDFGYEYNKGLRFLGSNELYDQDIRLYADGGLPEMGSIFVAGELNTGPELVGTINGRTGVASGQEITGISDAVYATGNEEAQLLRELIQAVRSTGLGAPSAAFGRYAAQSLKLYQGVTG